MPGCPDEFIEAYVYDELPGRGQLPWGLYEAILAWEFCELPLLTLAERGLKLSVPETPELEVSSSSTSEATISIADGVGSFESEVENNDYDRFKAGWHVSYLVLDVYPAVD